MPVTHVVDFSEWVTNCKIHQLDLKEYGQTIEYNMLSCD